MMPCLLLIGYSCSVYLWGITDVAPGRMILLLSGGVSICVYYLEPNNHNNLASMSVSLVRKTVSEKCKHVRKVVCFEDYWKTAVLGNETRNQLFFYDR